MKTIYLAGINNSGPGHWQRAWFERLGGVWVDHRNWDSPKAGDWVADLEIALARHPGPKVLMAHSLGVLLLSQWAMDHGEPGIQGAFLVAPPDVLSPAFPKEAKGFKAPNPARFPFPTAVVASRNDPYATFEYAGNLADQWGGKLIDAGEKGHINLKSNLGAWEEGFRLFQAFYGELAVKV